jgi:MSHA biogenesis protein MshP
VSTHFVRHVARTQMRAPLLAGAGVGQAQRGVSIVTALFLIVVLAAVGAFAVQIGASQQQTTNFAILENRALMAAYAGIEVGANRALLANACPETTFNTAGALTGFTVTVTSSIPCLPGPPFTTHSVNGVNYRLYTLTAVATRGAYGTPDFVSRTVVRTVTNAPLP